MLNYDPVQLSVSVNFLNIITTMIVSKSGTVFQKALIRSGLVKCDW